jgi:uncharacterized ferritin-like protein (DUF455 family)
MLTADPRAKVMKSRAAARAWRKGWLAFSFDADMPDRPARPDRPELLSPGEMPKRGKAGSARARIALLHALAHIEFVAIDLAWDLAGRFGALMPRAFMDDWTRIAAEESMHFALLERRLNALGSRYGDLPAHDGLWEAADATRHNILARLAVVPQVLEARGLDVTPETIRRLGSAGDTRSAVILQRILKDEIGHVRAGNYWFRRLCDDQGIDSASAFHAAVQQYFRGSLKPPFNDSARDSAGLTRDFYLPLAALTQPAP